MSFDQRDIRPKMDVYTKDNVYLGTVLALVPGPESHAPQHDPLEDANAAGQALTGSVVAGERLGPMPTAAIGNTGSAVQSARAGYGSQPDAAASLGHGSMLVGKWYGLLGKRRIPLALVQSFSLERVVLQLRSDEL